jgi:glycine oxidase
LAFNILLLKSYLVVGQGLAGISIATSLRAQGHTVHVIDHANAHRASSVAAGVINPITGKRFVFSWRYFDFFQTAKTFYQNLELQLGHTFWHDRSIVRLLQDLNESHTWLSRSGFEEYRAVMEPLEGAASWQPMLKKHTAFGKLNLAAQVNIPLLCSVWREQGLNESWFFERQVLSSDLDTLSKEYTAVILCCGHQVSDFGPFSGLPWRHAKGTVAHLRFDTDVLPNKNELLKKQILLAPIPNQEGLYWAGANYEWQATDTAATEQGITFIKNELDNTFQIPYQVQHTLAGIRPVAQDRRPVLGASKEWLNVFIFNGLGAKGALLAPYWAQHLADHILNGTALDVEVDMARFKL